MKTTHAVLTAIASAGIVAALDACSDQPRGPTHPFFDGPADTGAPPPPDDAADAKDGD